MCFLVKVAKVMYLGLATSYSIDGIVFLIQIRLFWVNICGLLFVCNIFHHFAKKDDSFKGPREFIGHD